MAARLTSDPTDSALTCSICLGHFDDPRALPCLHTFYLKCLTGVYDARRGNLTCPCCREVCTSQPKDLRKDFRIAKLWEMRPLMQMGLEVLEREAQAARTMLGGLKPARELQQVSSKCDEELKKLSQDQSAIDKMLDSALERCQGVIRDQRAAAHKSIEARRSELQAARRWAAESLEQRSSAEALLKCVSDGSQQSALELVGKFRQRSNAAPPARAEPRVTSPAPTMAGVCGELRAALADDETPPCSHAHDGDEFSEDSEDDLFEFLMND